MTTQTTTDLLRDLRARIRTNVSEDGIYLVYRSRYGQSAREVARLVRVLGGTVLPVQKLGLVRYHDHSSTKPWEVTFSVGIDEDLYLAGRVSMRAMLELSGTLGSIGKAA